MFNPLSWLTASGASVDSLYGMIVAQARLPVFYGRFGVPDRVDGRFDILVLHIVLVMRRLAREPGQARNAGQLIFDRFCRDMDDNLREMGVGDLAVPREMRRMGSAFYGRQAAYEAALATAEDRELVDALARNIYSDASAKAVGAAGLAAYVKEVVRCLDACESAAVWRAQFSFPVPEPDAVSRA
jgi:cytochrome b pre-mRNA-processing protein 3